MSARPYSLGVDLGTAFLTAAVARSDEVRTVALAGRAAAASAVVHVDDGIVAFGDLGERRAADRPDGALRGLRHRLGGGGTVVADGATYAVTALLGAQLRDVVRRVTDAEGGPPDRVALTVPASWDRERRARFAEVAADAGVSSPLVVTEAEAVVVALADRLRPGAVVAVYDLGAGFHATLVRRGVRGPEILGRPEDDEQIGGLAFDDAVVALVAETVAAGGVSLVVDEDDPQQAGELARLYRDCVRAKEALATAPEAVVPVRLPERTLEVRLTRSRVEERVRGPLEETMWALSRTIASAGLLPSDVGSVVVLGGSSRLPLVRRLLAQQFGRPLLPDVHPKLPVAHGAALLAWAAAARAAARAGPVVAGSGGAREGEVPEGPALAAATRFDDAERAGTRVDGAERDGSALDGAEPDGAAHDGAAHDGPGAAALDGADRDPVGLDGAGRDGTRPDGAGRDGARPGGDADADAWPGGAPLLAASYPGASYPGASYSGAPYSGASYREAPYPEVPLSRAVEPRLDPPTPLLVVPQASRAPAGGSRTWRSHIALPAAAAVVAALVLAGVALFAPGSPPVPVVPAVAPASSPVTTTPPPAAPTTPAPATTAPATTETSSATATPRRSRATATPRRTRATTTTRPRPRATAARPRTTTRTARPATPRTTRARPAAAADAADSADDQPAN